MTEGEKSEFKTETGLIIIIGRKTQNCAINLSEVTFSTISSPLDTNLITVCRLDEYFCSSVQQKLFPSRNRLESKFSHLRARLCWRVSGQQWLT